MCHQKEGAPQPKYPKATLIDAEGRVLTPVKVVEPVELKDGREIVRVYGNPKIVPGDIVVDGLTSSNPIPRSRAIRLIRELPRDHELLDSVKSLLREKVFEGGKESERDIRGKTAAVLAEFCGTEDQMTIDSLLGHEDPYVVRMTWGGIDSNLMKEAAMRERAYAALAEGGVPQLGAIYALLKPWRVDPTYRFPDEAKLLELMKSFDREEVHWQTREQVTYFLEKYAGIKSTYVNPLRQLMERTE